MIYAPSIYCKQPIFGLQNLEDQFMTERKKQEDFYGSALWSAEGATLTLPSHQIDSIDKSTSADAVLRIPADVTRNMPNGSGGGASRKSTAI